MSVSLTRRANTGILVGLLLLVTLAMLDGGREVLAQGFAPILGPIGSADTIFLNAGTTVNTLVFAAEPDGDDVTFSLVTPDFTSCLPGSSLVSETHFAQWGLLNGDVSGTPQMSVEGTVVDTGPPGSKRRYCACRRSRDPGDYSAWVFR